MRAYQINPRPLLKSRKPVRNPAYLKFIRSQPCCACGQNWGIEAAHSGCHGMGQKSSDLSCIPLCLKDHQTGNYALHKIGPVAFEQHFGIRIETIIVALLIRAAAAGIDLEGITPKKPMGRAGKMYRRRAA